MREHLISMKTIAERFKTTEGIIHLTCARSVNSFDFPE